MAINLHIERRVFLPGLLMLGMLIPGILIPDAADLHGQRSPFDPAMAGEAAQIREEVTVFTDRSLYIAEEPVCFSASLQDTGPVIRRPWSRVLYVELVSAEGISMAREKYQVHDGKTSGEIHIPSNLISGNYFLRTYTRWMRNWGPESYCYVPLRIINPHRPEMQKGIAPAEVSANLRVSSALSSSLEFEPHPAFFAGGERIVMQLSLPARRFQEGIRGCLTVVPRSAQPAAHHWEAELVNRAAEELPTGAYTGDSAGAFQLNFLPDKYGPSLSGSVVYPSGRDEGPSETRIHFTLMGDNPGYMVCRPEVSGRFAVALPFLSGKLELFVQPESMDGTAVEVRIDQDFDQRQLILPVASFDLADQEREAATIMARNVQLAGIYQDATSLVGKDSAAKEFPFYGSPTLSVDMDHYVLLPTLEEVFLNLVSSVTPVTRRKRNSLQIESENPTLSLFEPLVMVDQVPVFDMNKFMSVSPAKIKGIDVIEDVYVKGDLRFGGLINLISWDGDMAGIDLPGNSFFIDYQAMHPPAKKDMDQVSENDRMPDTRNTLLWLPDVVLEKSSPISISFNAPMYPGEYVVLFRGQGPGGELFVAETSFELVKPNPE
ncbi:MAG: hypothetical protein E4H10_12190 [Bacteroidia bacterium]|nr:MAG: hypothetical protein E4H10_12190 [Bacteroidia bacterium]